MIYFLMLFCHAESAIHIMNSGLNFQDKIKDFYSYPIYDYRKLFTYYEIYFSSNVNMYLMSDD